MDELCVAAVDDYASLAIALGRDEDFYRRVRMKLKSRLKELPMFDTALYCRDFEKAILKVIELVFTHSMGGA